MSALSPLSPAAMLGSLRSAARSDAAQDRKGEGPQFSELLGAGPAEKPSAPVREAVKARDGKDHDDDRDEESGNAATIDPALALPAWLQALRAPAAAAGAATTGDGDALAAVTSAADGQPSRSGVSTQPLLPDGDFASTGNAPSAAGADADWMSRQDAAQPLMPAAGGDGELALDIAPKALDALDALIAKPDQPALPVAPVAVDRTSAVPLPTGNAAAAAATAGQGGALDAFGEPLALDGPDAAVRLGERLRWLSEAGVQEARLQLHPKELGAIDVRIRVEQQTASVWFGADHPAARAALESTLPQLRERLAADGLQLGQAQIGNGFSPGADRQGTSADGQRQPSGPATGGQSERAEATSVVPASTAGPAPASRHRGLIDRYV